MNIVESIQKHFGSKEVSSYYQYNDPRTDKPAMLVFNFEEDRIVFFYVFSDMEKEYQLQISLYTAGSTYTVGFVNDQEKKTFFSLMELLEQYAKRGGSIGTP